MGEPGGDDAAAPDAVNTQPAGDSFTKRLP